MSEILKFKYSCVSFVYEAEVNSVLVGVVSGRIHLNSSILLHKTGHCTALCAGVDSIVANVA